MVRGGKCWCVSATENLRTDCKPGEGSVCIITYNANRCCRLPAFWLVLRLRLRLILACSGFLFPAILSAFSVALSPFLPSFSFFHIAINIFCFSAALIAGRTGCREGRENIEKTRKKQDIALYAAAPIWAGYRLRYMQAVFRFNKTFLICISSIII